MLIILLFVVVMTGTALRFYHLDAGDLGGDEIITATVAQQDVASILHFHLEKGGNPPLLSLITHLFFITWGHSEFIARLPAALFGSLSVLLAYKLGEMLWTRQVGIMGALLLAVSAYHVWFSQIARYYGLMVFLALLSLILLIKALQNDNKALWTGFIISTALGLYNHYFALLFVPAEVAFGAWVITQNRLSRQTKGAADVPAGEPQTTPPPATQSLLLCTSVTVIGLLYLPWVPRLVERSSPALPSGAPALSTVSVELSLRFLHRVLVTYTSTNGVALLAALGLFLAGLVTCGRERLLLVLLWIGTPFVFVAVVGPGHFLLPKYVLYILPVYLLLLATGTVSIARWARLLLSKVRALPARAAAPIATITVLLLGGLNIPPLQSHYVRQTEDWSLAVEYMADNLAPGDVIIADNLAYSIRKTDRPVQALNYYFSLTGLDVAILGPQQIADAVQKLAEKQPTIWGVLRHQRRPRDLQRARENAEIARFPKVLVISSPTSGSDWASDASAVLRAMLELQPSDRRRFHYYLALAEISAYRGELSEASSYLVLAQLAMPDREKAARDLAEASGELGELLGPHLNRASFGDSLLLPSYRIQPTTLEPGQTLSIDVRLDALRPMDKDYTLFVHLIGPEGRIWAHEDRLLEHDGLPTSTWEAGLAIMEQYQLELPSNAPSGEYTVQAGVYYWQSGERLPVWDESGQRVPEDVIVLDRVTLTD